MSSGSGSAPAIALIGCGAISDVFHLPALARRAEVRDRLILVDRDTDRARALADKFGASEVCADHREVLDRIDGAVIAVPRQLHASIALECLKRGVHVLCEKPLCETPDEVREIMEASSAAGVQVAINQTRRLWPAFQEVRELLAAGALGPLRRLDYVLGEEFDWPAATDSYFGAKASGKGILLEQGAHIVDLVCWWLGGRPRLVDYRDDSFGGTEAVCELALERDGCEARIVLSWLAKHENGYRIEGERGRIEGGVYDWASYARSADGGSLRKHRTAWRPHAFEEFGGVLIDNFLAVLAGSARPVATPADVLPSIEIIDACYRRRARFDMPWHDAWERAAHG